MDRRRRAREREVEREVAVGHRVHAVLGQRLQAELACHCRPRERERGTGQRAGAKRHRARRLERAGESLGVPEQRFCVSQQVVADGDRLGTLEMRVTGHRPRGVSESLGGDRIDQLAKRVRRLPRGIAAVEPQVERDLVVARAPGVQRGTRRGDLGQTPLDRRVDVLVGRLEPEISCVKLAPDPAQSSFDRGQL